MKRFQLFSLASAMLLASAAGFTSCSSDSEDPLDGGSGVAGQVVKTQFVINIPYAGNESGGNARVSTRMTAENTQNNNNFLGLKDIEMFAFDKAPGGTNTTSTRTIRIRTDASSSNNDYRRIYSDIAIPVGTTNMILYARATRTKTVASGIANKTNFEAGSLTNPYGNFTDEAKPNLSDFEFNLEAIHKNNDFNEKGQAILNKLNDIANTTTKDGSKWSEVGNSQTADNDAKILQSLYTKFISLTAGSANSVNSFIKHLKTAIESQGVNTEMAQAIKAKCTPISGTFPRNLSLPDGVVRVQFDTTNGFMFKTATAGTTTTGSNLIDYKTVTYPSELAYYVSSPIKTSTTYKSKVGELPKYDEWLANTTNIWNGYGDIVQNNTLFVALQNPVQYGVACLKSSIKCSGTLEDNAKAKIGSESNNTITVDDKSFPITGILIGGQPAGVKWDFEPASTTKPADFKYTIYDKNMNDGINFTAKAVATTTLPYNYTLVLDNKDTSDGATQSNVNVVIELENNAADFYGAEGLIPKGSKFYLAGTLDLKATSGVIQPTGEIIDHVFVKDHTTVANFTIKDLKKAYNCIPDLRTSKINVGLAVDLSWQDGITFNVDL